MFLYQEQVLPLADYYVGQESKLSITISYFFLYNTIKLFLFFGKKLISLIKVFLFNGTLSNHFCDSIYQWNKTPG